MKSSKKSFTLVELIIVIAIIAILAVTAFLVLTKWLGKSRDSRRVSDLTTMDTALQIYVTEKNTLPRPENAITINASGTVIGYQGVFTDNTMSVLGNIKPTPLDPTDNTNYIYYVDSSSKNYQLLGFTEQTSSVLTTANAVDYSVRFIQTRGSKLGILLSGDNTPVNLISGIGTGLDVQNTTGTYNAYFDSSNKLSGTGATLQWLASTVNNGGAGFDAPSTCPTGFIPVPGNKDSNQLGFCVAKYEMKQINGTAGYLNSSILRITGINEICGTGTTTLCRASNINMTGATIRLDGNIISKADGLPIVNLNQATAIEACSKMGAGYHLITNNEWMTIARNIEQQGKNRTGGVVGSGGIYRGKDYWATDINISLNNNSNSLDCNMGTDINGLEITGSLAGNANSLACQLSNGRNKRELYLSNGQTIWDLAGNVGEHVNKASTIDGSSFNTGSFLLSTACSNGNSRRSFYGNDGVAECIRTNNYSYSLLGPKTLNLNASNGMGRIYSSSTPNNLFLRGGNGANGLNSGIFTTSLVRDAPSSATSVGFRCAR